MIVGVDVDGVTADMNPVWVAKYNELYGAPFMTEAEIYHERAKKDHFFMDLLHDPHLYDYVLPIHLSIWGVNQLRGMGHRVVFITSCTQNQTDQKWRWLQKFGLLPEGKFQADDLVVTHDKSLAKADVLVDDSLKNLATYPHQILFTQPHNADTPLTNGTHRANTWPEVVALIEEIR